MAGSTIPNRGKLVYVKAKKTKPHEGGQWSDTKRREAVCLWVGGMQPTPISHQLNIPLNTINKWKQQEWWAEMVTELRSDDKQVLDAKLTKILDKSLETIMDRLENGEYIYDQKTGKIKQTPVKMRDATVAFNTIMDKRQLIRKEPTKITEQSSSAAQLQNLAQQFAAFVTNQAPKEKLVAHYIENETVTQNEDGSYTLKD